MLLSLFLFLFGLFAGTIGTMLGVGGGFLHVPFLALLFNFSPQAAIGTSIGIIFMNTLAGSMIYYHQNRLDKELAKKLSFAVIPGAILAPLLVQKYTSMFFFILFAIVLIITSGYLFYKEKVITVLPERKYDRVKTIKDVFGKSVTYSTNLELGVIGTFVISFLGNLFGIGGGTIHVPYLILILRMPTHLALGTSHFILCISSCIGMIMFFLYGNVQIDYMMPIGLGTIIGARIGAEMARKTDEIIIRKILAVILILIAIKMFINAF